MGWEHELSYGKGRPAVPVSLAPIDLPDVDIEREAKEAAERVAERRIIRTAREAWSASHKANSLDAIGTIGKALLIGRAYAMRVNGVSIPKGRGYSLTLRRWMKANGFGSMSNTTRKHIVILTESAGVTAWWSKLPEHERNRMANAQHIYRRWQATLKNGHGKCLAYVKRDAVTALRRLITSTKLLPASEREPLRQMALAEMAAMAHV